MQLLLLQELVVDVVAAHVVVVVVVAAHVVTVVVIVAVVGCGILQMLSTD